MKVGNSGNRGADWDSRSHKKADGSSGIDSVVYEIHKKKVKIKRKEVLEEAEEVANIAYQMGETNDASLYANTMTDDILKALSTDK